MDNNLAERIRNTLPLLDERERRLYLANEAKSLGYGGISLVSKISGVSRVTITQGMVEINSQGYQTMANSRSRKKGGGRKTIETKNPDFLSNLELLIEPHTKGDPTNPLRWTSKSMIKLEAALKEKGFVVSARTIVVKLKSQGFSLQSNKKDLSLTSNHTDPDAQFEYINKTAKEYIKAGHPAISIDAKKWNT
jgi:transposase